MGDDPRVSPPPLKQYTFNQFLNSVHATHRRAYEAAGLADWAAFEALAQQSDEELFDIPGFGPAIVFATRQSLFYRGVGPDPGDWQAARQRWEDGPQFEELGPARKLGLNKAARETLTALGVKTWDDLRALTNLDLIRASTYRCAWVIRSAQHRAGQGPDPGPEPVYGEGVHRFYQGGRADQPLPPLSPEQDIKFAELLGALGEIERQQAALWSQAAERLTQVRELLWGHVNYDDRRALRRRIGWSRPSNDLLRYLLGDHWD